MPPAASSAAGSIRLTTDITTSFETGEPTLRLTGHDFHTPPRTLTTALDLNQKTDISRRSGFIRRKASARRESELTSHKPRVAVPEKHGHRHHDHGRRRVEVLTSPSEKLVA